MRWAGAITAQCCTAMSALPTGCCQWTGTPPDSGDPAGHANGMAQKRHPATNPDGTNTQPRLFDRGCGQCLLYNKHCVECTMCV
jgi:hypothetical protein